MSIEFRGANAVVLARQAFNPSNFSLAWTVRQLRIPPEDFPEEGVVQSPMLFYIPTGRFSLAVIQERIQLSLNSIADEEGEEVEGDLVRRIMRETINHVQQFASHGAGFNFNWTLISERPNRETSRRLFSADDKPFYREFAANDSCFGVYASKDYLGTRMRVEARPIYDPNAEPDSRRVFFNFNFNLDLVEGNEIASIEQLLNHWEEAKQEALRIMNLVSRESET